MPQLDYSSAGMTIQQAFMDLVRRYPDKRTRPDHIVWNGDAVKLADSWQVENAGKVYAEFLVHRGEVGQGFDLSFDSGELILQGGEKVKTLRTWFDSKFENSVEYPFVVNDGLMWVWNVYRRPSGKDWVEEKWIGNAGMKVEYISRIERVYHCSHGPAKSPDFESLVFRVRVISRPTVR